MKKDKNQTNDLIKDDEWKVVESRLKTMPSKMRLGILSKSYGRPELLMEVQNRTDVGRAYVEMQIGFVKWLVKQSKVSPSL